MLEPRREVEAFGRSVGGIRRERSSRADRFLTIRRPDSRDPARCVGSSDPLTLSGAKSACSDRVMRLPTTLFLLAMLLTACRSGDFTERAAIIGDPSTVTCEPRGGGDFRSQLVRSPVLLSRSGDHRAYAEVEAIALHDPVGGNRSCQNVSRLYVSESASGPFRLLFTQNPGGEGRNGNSLRLVDWSPDDSRLLAELYTWIYPNQIGNPLVLEVDLRDGSVSATDVDKRVRARLDEPCSFAIDVVGYSPEGTVVIRTAPAPPSLEGPPCEIDPTHWLVHEREETLEALPPGWRIQRYGWTR